MINQIAPTIQKPGIKDIIELRMIPYGNARETQVGGKYVFQCQHGPKVCFKIDTTNTRRSVKAT